MMSNLFKDFKALFLLIMCSCILSLMFLGCEKHNLSGISRSFSGSTNSEDQSNDGNVDDDDSGEDDDENTAISDDDDDSDSNSKSTKTKSSDIDADDDDDVRIDEETYTVDNLKAEEGSITIDRLEKDCLEGKCSAELSLSLYSIGGTKVSSDVVEKFTTKVTLSKSGVRGDLSKLCPKVSNKEIVYSMSMLYGGATLDGSNRSILVGGRGDNKTLMVGVADKNDGYNFHNIDTIIVTIQCPNVKKISILDLCEDINLDDSKLRTCWVTEGKNSSCPSHNVYKNSQYRVECRDSD